MSAARLRLRVLEARFGVCAPQSTTRIRDRHLSCGATTSRRARREVEAGALQAPSSRSDAQAAAEARSAGTARALPLERDRRRGFCSTCLFTFAKAMTDFPLTSEFDNRSTRRHQISRAPRWEKFNKFPARPKTAANSRDTRQVSGKNLF